MDRLNWFDLDTSRMATELAAWGEPAYRAQQLIQWVHQHHTIDPNAMTNLSKGLRERVAQDGVFALPKLLHTHASDDGTIKWLLGLAGGGAVETVYIPEATRATLCVSSQVGCALDCQFCATAKQGFNRNLTTAEIIGQLWLAVDQLQRKHLDASPITNVVFMGMGEPLLNEANLHAALELMLSDHAYGLSKYRVTVSTSGVVPAMERLKQASDCALAVSLHAPTNALRDRLVPLNRKYPLEQLMPACAAYFDRQPKRKVTFEYVMLSGVNDQPEHAKALIRLLNTYQVPCKLNLIPFNPIPEADFVTSAPAACSAFQKRLMDAGFQTNVRKTRGDDVSAACGQLEGHVSDRTRRTHAGRTRRKGSQS